MHLIASLSLLAMVAVMAGCMRPAAVHMAQRAEMAHPSDESHAHTAPKRSPRWTALAAGHADLPVLVTLRPSQQAPLFSGVKIANVAVSVVSADLSWYASGSAVPDGEGAFTLTLPLPSSGDYVLFLEHVEGHQRIASVTSLTYTGVKSQQVPIIEADHQVVAACPLLVAVERDSSGAIQVACRIQDGVARAPSSTVTVCRGLIVSHDGGRGVQIAPLTSSSSDSVSEAVLFTRVHAQPGAYRIWVEYQVAGLPSHVAQDVVIEEVAWKDRPWWETTSHAH